MKVRGMRGFESMEKIMIQRSKVSVAANTKLFTDLTLNMEEKIFYKTQGKDNYIGLVILYLPFP